MKTVYQDEKNVILDENSVEWKPCINRESKSLELTIKLYSCHDINMSFLVFVTPPSIYHIWTPTKLLYKHQIMFWIFGSFDIVTMIFFHEFCMLYHVWLCSCHPCNLILFFFFFIANYPIRICFGQVINYNWIKTIKSEPTFGKSSICRQSSLSNKKEHLTIYQF